uniref:Uncharacterized protein n=1 Tax=Arundo donax TaxID=35708 RepID=A0A0A8Y4Z1_ARUDO
MSIFIRVQTHCHCAPRVTSEYLQLVSKYLGVLLFCSFIHLLHYHVFGSLDLRQRHISKHIYQHCLQILQLPRWVSFYEGLIFICNPPSYHKLVISPLRTSVIGRICLDLEPVTL